jgi:hypothetical protein
MPRRTLAAGIASLSTREKVVGAVTWVCVLTGFVFLFMPGPLKLGTIVTSAAAALSPLALSGAFSAPRRRSR